MIRRAGISRPGLLKTGGMAAGLCTDLEVLLGRSGVWGLLGTSRKRYQTEVPVPSSVGGGRRWRSI